MSSDERSLVPRVEGPIIEEISSTPFKKGKRYLPEREPEYTVRSPSMLSMDTGYSGPHFSTATKATSSGGRKAGAESITAAMGQMMLGAVEENASREMVERPSHKYELRSRTKVENERRVLSEEDKSLLSFRDEAIAMERKSQKREMASSNRGYQSVREERRVTHERDFMEMQTRMHQGRLAPQEQEVERRAARNERNSVPLEHYMGKRVQSPERSERTRATTVPAHKSSVATHAVTEKKKSRFAKFSCLSGEKSDTEDSEWTPNIGRKSRSKERIQKNSWKKQENRTGHIEKAIVEQEEIAVGSHLPVSESIDVERQSSRTARIDEPGTSADAMEIDESSPKIDTNDADSAYELQHTTLQRLYRKAHPGEDESHSKRQSEYKKRHPDKHSSQEAKRYEAVKRREQLETSDSEENVITSAHPDEYYLGLRNNICPFCGAKHFPGYHICCNKGKIFIPPFKELPEPMYSVTYQINTPEHNKYLNNILGLNNLFSFASIQYNRVPVEPFGVQAAKSRGTIRHFPSAIRPNNPNYPHYGNFYIYDAAKATESRIGSQYFKDSMDKSLISSIGSCLAKINPFAKMYKAMHEIMKDEEDRTGIEPTQMRMKIVDPFEYKKQEKELQAHPSVYGSGNVGDYVVVIYNCDIDQQMKTPGLTIYPKLGDSTPRPIFTWMKEINGLCYPLLFPYGELGWHWKGHEIMTNPLPFKERLENYFAENPPLLNDMNEEMISFLNPPQIQTASKSDSNLESDSGSEPDKERQHKQGQHDEEYDKQLEQLATGTINQSEVIITMQERNGEIYPIRKLRGSVRAISAINETDSEETESDTEDEIPGQQTNDIVEYQEFNEPSTSGVNWNERNSTSDITAASSTSGAQNTMEHMRIEEPIVVADTIPEQEEESPEIHHHRIYVSEREWALYVGQDRVTDKNQHNRISSAGKLGQVFLIDICTRILRSRYAEIEKHHTQFKTSTRQKLINALQTIADLYDREVGCVTSIPVSVAGSPRNLQRKFEDAVAMANQLGPPDLFITFTASMNWKEINENVTRGYKWADNPFMVNEVFKKKFDEFLVDLLGEKHRDSVGRTKHRGGIFGKVLWYTFSTEFQSRGPPHVHLIVSLKNHIKTTEQIERICKAELPKYDGSDEEMEEWIERLRRNVEGLMIHRPCEKNPKAYCRKKCLAHWARCKKDFPKEFSNVTQFGDRHYPILIRRDDGDYVKKKTSKGYVRADNRHVVPYNEFLLNKYRSHINVEVISSAKQVKYIFKYVFKGFDRVLVECFVDDGSGPSPFFTAEMTMDGHVMFATKLKYPKGNILERDSAAVALLRQHGIKPTDANGKPVVVYNECHQIEDMRSMTACEAAWILQNFPRYGASHTVETLFVHEPRDEPIRMELGQELNEEMEAMLEKDINTKLLAWFELNKTCEEANKYTFEELPKYFTFTHGVWRKRKHDLSVHIIGHIKSIKPRFMEKYAIRLLSQNQKGPTSFEMLRTVDGRVYESFVDAAKALRLMNSQIEWEMAMTEAANLENPIALRRMFGSILINCAPANPEELWENFKAEMYENKATWSEQTKEAHALFHIQSILQYHGLQLRNFFLPDVNVANLPHQKHLVNDQEQNTVSVPEAKEMGEWKFQTLSPEQKTIGQRILRAIAQKQSTWIEGEGGCGKSWLFNYLYYVLVGMNHKVLCVAHVGVAATLLPDGSTVHRAFSVPLETSDTMTCNVDLESGKARNLRECTVILWDEATMSDRRIISCVSYLLQTLHGNDAPFGGIPVVFGGNWMQTLPIVDGARDEAVLKYTIKKTNLWPILLHLKLTNNIRAQEDPVFAQWVHKIGNGLNYVGIEEVEIPPQLLIETEQELIDFVYGQGQVNNLDLCAKSAILTVDNISALDINNKVIRMLNGEERSYLSTDEYDPDKGFHEMDNETYHLMTPSGLPPHQLILKVGATVTLLRNLNVLMNLCNGTKLVITELCDNFIVCKVLNPTPFTPEVIYLHRMALQSTAKMRRDIAFIRWQFPIRLAYAMTINKAQGQTLERAGVLLRTPVFQHGQLYVAVSRARCFNQLRICNRSTTEPTIARNVVYKDILDNDNTNI